MKFFTAALLFALLAVSALATPNLISKKSIYASTGAMPTVGNEMIVTIEIFNVGSRCVPCPRSLFFLAHLVQSFPLLKRINFLC